MPNKILRCAIYIRVSTAEQLMHGKSLQAQKDYLASYANDHGMTVVGVYADEGKTARKELKKRKAIHALLEDVKAGKIDVILFLAGLTGGSGTCLTSIKSRTSWIPAESGGSRHQSQASTWRPGTDACS